jgi:spermidine synthase
VTIFQEAVYQGHAQALTVEETLYQGRTAYQDVLIFRNETFGNVMTLDGIVQLTDLDNHVYHEMMAHVPLAAHGAAKDVLIIGGGDGGVLKEVLKHPVGHVTLVEIDPEVIALSRRYFPAVSAGAFDDPRVSVRLEDAVKYVAAADRQFDVAIIDSTDPVGPGEALFSDTFYANCRALLRAGGLVVLQSGTPFFRPADLDRICQRLDACFGAAKPFFAPVPTYAHGQLALIAAGPSEAALCPPPDTLAQSIAPLSDRLRYYSPRIHHAAFAIASALRNSIASDNKGK